MLLENAYPKWEEMVKSAKERIVVFTPYLDDTLVKLLEQKKEVERIVVTSIEPQYINENPQQIIALKKLSDENILIKHLEYLHAKILLIDKKLITIGSQNFTKRGKSINREATLFIDKEELIEQYLKDVLQAWLDDSINVDKYLIELMYEKFKDLDAKHSEKQLKSIKGQINRLKKKAFAQEVKEQSKLNEKFSFVADIEYNNEQGYYYLKYPQKRFLWGYRTMMIPLINLDTMELRFARVAGGQISKIGEGVNLGKRTSKEFKEVFSDVGVNLSFSKKETKDDANINITLRFPNKNYPFYKKVEINLLFTGFYFKNIRIITDYSELKELVKKNLFKSLSEVPNEGLITSLFESFKYKKPFSSSKSQVGSFVGKKGRYIIRGINDEFDNLFLIIEQKKRHVH
jgi:hypothetical protein